VIPANKGNIYSADGSLLTSIPNYEIRFDAVAPKAETFEKNESLSDSLATVLGNLLISLKTNCEKRDNKNRYYLIARKLSYTQYFKIKGFPFKLEPIKVELSFNKKR
jgi:cell division protein FtsI (penicillin-binding protein 3)